MPLVFDPLLSLSFLFVQIGNRYLKINVTKAQSRIIYHPYFQTILYASVVYYSTRNILNTAIIVVASYVLLYVLLNENSEYNILPSKLLYEENISQELISYRENYKTNFEKLHL